MNNKLKKKEIAESISKADETTREQHPIEEEQIEQDTDKDQLSLDDIIRKTASLSVTSV